MFTIELAKTGKPHILYKSFKYRESYSVKSGDVVWRCLGRTCGATVKTDESKINIISANEKHSGPHPVTMNRLSSPRPVASPSASPAAESDLPSASTPRAATPAPESRPSPLCTPTSRLPVDTSLSSAPNVLEIENAELKEELARLKYQLQCVLNHTIESDTRLLQYTDEIFVAGTPQTKETSSAVKIDRATQFEPPTLCSEELCVKTRDLVSSLKTTIEVLEAEVNVLRVENKTCHCLREGGVGEWTLYDKKTSPTQTKNIYFNNDNFTTVRNKKNKKTKSNKTTTQDRKPIKGQHIDLSNYKKVPVSYSNVTVLGDSHCRGLAARMTARTTPNTRTTGVCKPGAGLLNVIPSSTPPDHHAYVVVAGTNDVAAGRQGIVFQHMESLIKKCKESSRVLVSPLPPRYDLPLTSPVHESVVMVNHFISELCRRHEGVEMLDLSDLGREHFTRHGLHLNAAGKNLLAALIIQKLAVTPSHQRRSCPEKKTATSSQTLPPTSPASPPSPTTLSHDTYADAVIKGPAMRNITHRKPLPTRLTNAKTGLNEQFFLGTPLTAKAVN